MKARAGRGLSRESEGAGSKGREGVRERDRETRREECGTQRRREGGMRGRSGARERTRTHRHTQGGGEIPNTVSSTLALGWSCRALTPRCEESFSGAPSGHEESSCVPWEGRGGGFGAGS
eukprot:2120759-Rhodomonas_salina.2